MTNNIVIAVAVSCSDSRFLYSVPLYTAEDINRVRTSTHPDIEPNYRVMIVHADMSAEDLS